MKYMKKSFSQMVPYHSELLTEGVIINSNESPYNPPKAIIDEFHKKIQNLDFNRYPDMDENELDEAIAKHYGVKRENITVGVGSDELLDVTFRCCLNPGDYVLGFSPSFSMYKVFTELVGGNYIPITGDENFLFNVDEMIEKIKEYKPKMVLVCSPNNPTGQFFEKKDIIRIIEASKESLVCLDLAYIDFAKEDYATLALDYDNVISFKTFSKALSLPSIRVGYAISNKDNIDMLNAVKAPYSVTTLSQIMATIAINNFDLYKPQIELIKSERSRLLKELKALGYRVFDSESNFIYLIMNEKINDILVQNKIYIRHFKGENFRISVGSKEENDKLLEVLKTCVNLK